MTDRLPRSRRIITNNDTLRTEYHDLRAGDAFIGRVRLASSEEGLLVDLLERGILLFPAALAQLAARSKTMQARLFAEFLPPDTHAVHDQHELLRLVNLFGARNIGRIITKRDRKNAGLGINLWNSIEEVWNQCSCKALPLPLVVQPFLPDCRDVRVIILGDYQEAYQRHNPHNFRHNLHCGGSSSPYALNADQLDLCRRVMARGKFPYAHLDLLVDETGATYLSEINLRGGICGAAITPQQYKEKLTAIHDAAQENLPPG